MPHTVCDLILVSYNKLEYTRPCIESILANTDVPYRLLIVDNGSNAPTLSFLEDLASRYPHLVVLLKHSDNLGWVKAVNSGIAHSTAPYVCFLNNDLLVTAGWLERLIEVAQADPAIGLVNPTYNGRGQSLDQLIQQCHADTAMRGDLLYQELNECNGACLLVKREVITHIGVLDEIYGLGGMDDADYSRRAQLAGFRCAQAKQSYVFHWENVTCNTIPKYWSEIRRKNIEHFRQRWGERKQIGVVIPGHDLGHGLSWIRQALAFARVGLQLHLWGLVQSGSPLRDSEARGRFGIVEHNNLRWRFWPPAHWGFGFFLMNVLAVAVTFTVLGRRWKHKSHRIQALIVPSGFLRVWLTQLRWIHGAPLYERFEDCPLISRELQWIRRIDSPSA